MSFTNKPFVFPHGIKIHCTFLNAPIAERAEMHQHSIYVPLHHQLELSQYWTDEVKMIVSKICTQQQKVCTCSQFPIPTNFITCCITISFSMTVLDLVVTVNKLVVTVPDSIMKLVVVDTMIDLFVTVLDLLVKE